MEMKVNAKQFDDSVREVERGSRIVCITPDDVQVVLQVSARLLHFSFMKQSDKVHLPQRCHEATWKPSSHEPFVWTRSENTWISKQNLFFPHSLSLSLFWHRLEFGSAISLMRKHRIDMNFAYDHNPTAFLNYIEDFVKQVNNVDYLNLFISSLRFLFFLLSPSPLLFLLLCCCLFAHQTKKKENSEEDLTLVFAPPEKPKVPVAALPEKKNKNKVNTVCKELRAVFQRLDPAKFLLCILTTYVKNQPPELDQVLRVIQNLRGEAKPKKRKTDCCELTHLFLSFVFVFLQRRKK
jgi:hypothetical protein